MRNTTCRQDPAGLNMKQIMIGSRPASRARPFAALTLALLSACASGVRSRAAPIDVAGIWEGEARLGETSLPLAVTIDRPGGEWAGDVDVPSQYAEGYRLANLHVDSGTLSFSFPDVLPPAAFEGNIERGTARGHFTSSVERDTLRGTFELRRRPARTVSYASESVRFRNGDLELAGTLLRPLTPGPHPAVVFVHGSGPQTRDSYLRWFGVQFVRAGFVALIFDKRGTGESGGEPWPDTPGSFVDLADDAVAAARFLAADSHVDASRIGVWGLSQGAWIAPLAVVRAPSVLRFVIMISGGGVTPAEQEIYDDEIKLRDLGFAPAEIEQAVDYLRLADQYVRRGSDEDWDRFARARDEARGKTWYPRLDRFPQILPREAPVWVGLRTDLDYDPTATLATVRVPVLLVLGAEDRLTPARETALRVRQALESAGNRIVTVRIYPDADHALLVKPTRQAPWLAERPAPDWVKEMIQWSLGLK